MIDLNEKRLTALHDLLTTTLNDVVKLLAYVSLRESRVCEIKEIAIAANFTNSSLRTEVAMINKLVYAEELVHQFEDERETQTITELDIDPNLL